MKHTKEPWRVNDRTGIVKIFANTDKVDTASGLPIATVVAQWPPDIFDFSKYAAETRKANAARIVACVNACAGIPNEVLLSDNRKHDAFFEAMELQMKLDATRKELARPLNAIEGGTREQGGYRQSIGDAYIKHIRTTCGIEE